LEVGCWLVLRDDQSKEDGWERNTTMPDQT
jgi:hypothetical protein